MLAGSEICPALNRANARIRAVTDDTDIMFAGRFIRPIAIHILSYYVHSDCNQGLTVITAPPVLPANRAGASETRQKHEAITPYTPMISRWTATKGNDAAPQVGGSTGIKSTPQTTPPTGGRLFVTPRTRKRVLYVLRIRQPEPAPHQYRYRPTLEECRPRASLQVDNCDLSTVELQSTSRPAAASQARRARAEALGIQGRAASGRL